jgi:hypothetical protein
LLVVGILIDSGRAIGVRFNHVTRRAPSTLVDLYAGQRMAFGKIAQMYSQNESAAASIEQGRDPDP